MSRVGAVAVLVAHQQRLGRQHDETKSHGERSLIQGRLGSLKQLILDVRAGRVGSIRGQGLEIIIKDYNLQSSCTIAVFVTPPPIARTVISSLLRRAIFVADKAAGFSLNDGADGKRPEGIPYRYQDGRIGPHMNEGMADPAGIVGVRESDDPLRDSSYLRLAPPPPKGGQGVLAPAVMQRVKSGVPAFALEYNLDEGLVAMAATPTLVKYFAVDETRLLPVRVTERQAGKSKWYEVETFHENVARWLVRKSFAKKGIAMEDAATMGRLNEAEG